MIKISSFFVLENSLYIEVCISICISIISISNVVFPFYLYAFSKKAQKLHCWFSLCSCEILPSNAPTWLSKACSRIKSGSLPQLHSLLQVHANLQSSVFWAKTYVNCCARGVKNISDWEHLKVFHSTLCLIIQHKAGSILFYFFIKAIKTTQVKFYIKSNLTTTKQAIRIKLPSHICYSRTGLTGIATFVRIKLFSYM